MAARVATGWTADNEAQRVALNRWIRDEADFDGIIDFDRLMAGGPIVELVGGGAAPQIPPQWNCDNTHPNAAEGTRRWASTST